MSSAYSDLKALWHLDDIAALRRGDQIVPHQMQLILSDLCNQDCSFCAFRMSNGFSSENFAGPDGERNPKRMIEETKALGILYDAALLGVRAVQFTGGGEPTVHPQHLLIFKKARDYGLETSLVTNGVLLREGWDEVYPLMSWIRVSIDAGSDETYSAVRNVPRGTYEKALRNLTSIVEACAGRETVVGAGFVVTPENYHEIIPGVEAIKATGVSNVRLSAMFSTDYEEPFRGIYLKIQEKIHAARERYECSAFRVYDLFGERLSDLKQDGPDYSFCGYQQFNVYVGGDLKVYRCCTTAYTDHGEIGDLSEQSFAEWWASEEKRAAYGDFDARSCRVCQFNGKNRAINYVVGEEPTHVQFV